jgi:hypothetical protein
LMAMVWWWCAVDVVAACGAVRASAGSRRWSCSYSGAVPRPLFVARPLSKVERGRQKVAVAQATNRGVVVREPGMLGPPRQPQRCVWSVSQREVVSLPRARVSFGGSGAVCVRGSPAGRDVGGIWSGWGAQVAICQQ